jgi:hypothetical protein
MKKTSMKGKSPTHGCECSPKNTNMHKLRKMGYEPKMQVSSPKTPA